MLPIGNTLLPVRKIVPVPGKYIRSTRYIVVLTPVGKIVLPVGSVELPVANIVPLGISCNMRCLVVIYKAAKNGVTAFLEAVDDGGNNPQGG